MPLDDIEPQRPTPAVGGPTRQVLVVTGMSGAGKSTALKALEDCGFEAVDNLPLSLLCHLVEQTSAEGRSVVIGADIRTRDFGVEELLTRMNALMTAPGLAVELVFLDCDDEIIARRYTETRRRHPLTQDWALTEGLRHERQLILPLRDRADLVIDTTLLSPHDLRRILNGRYRRDVAPSLAIFVTSFSYRRGLPREADLVLDMRFLQNPHYVAELSHLTGREPAVGDYIEADPTFAPFMYGLLRLLDLLLPRYEAEGKSYLTIAFGCTGGRHRSVHLAERTAAWLSGRGARVQVAHRDIAGSEPRQPRNAIPAGAREAR